MAKKTIKTLLKTKENEILSTCQALVQKSSIQYIENNCKMNLYFTKDVVKMLRKNEEYEIFFEFQKKSASGFIKLVTGEQIALDISLKTIEVTDTKIFISYQLNEEEYEYSINY